MNIRLGGSPGYTGSQNLFGSNPTGGVRPGLGSGSGFSDIDSMVSMMNAGKTGNNAFDLSKIPSIGMGAIQSLGSSAMGGMSAIGNMIKGLVMGLIGKLMSSIMGGLGGGAGGGGLGGI